MQQAVDTEVEIGYLTIVRDLEHISDAAWSVVGDRQPTRDATAVDHRRTHTGRCADAYAELVVAVAKAACGVDRKSQRLAADRARPDPDNEWCPSRCALRRNRPVGR